MGSKKEGCLLASLGWVPFSSKGLYAWDQDKTTDYTSHNRVPSLWIGVHNAMGFFRFHSEEVLFSANKKAWRSKEDKVLIVFYINHAFMSSHTVFSPMVMPLKPVSCRIFGFLSSHEMVCNKPYQR